MKTRALFFSSLATDIGRVLAASTIFYFHIGLSGHYVFSRYGEYAVEYFVILSGVAYILFSHSQPSTPAEYFNYVKKRLAALFPLYLLINVILYGGSFLYHSELGRPYDFSEFLASVAGASMIFGWKFLSSTMWFMPFILQVYLLLPLIDRLARRMNPVVLVIFAFGVSCFLAQLVPCWVHDEQTLKLVCKNWSPVFRLPEVCVGIILGRSVLIQTEYGKGMLAVMTFGILSFAASHMESAGVKLFVYLPWGGFWVPLVIFLAAALVSSLLSSVDAKIFRLLALASFPFFLFHAAPLRAISHRFGSVFSLWAIYFLACWAVAVGLTWLDARVKNRIAGAMDRAKD